MATEPIKISEMTEASTMGSTDIIPIVQGGINKKATVQKVIDLILPMSSYTVDFQQTVTVMSDINLEGNITITTLQGLNIASLKLNNVSQALGTGLSIAVANGAVLTWEITRTTGGYAALGIKFTRS